MRSVTMMNQVPTLPALGERCSVLDTVSKRARTPLRSPICARGQKCLLVDNARDEIASDMCESSVTSKSHGRVCKLIDLVLSSSIEDTVRVVDETDALRTLVSSTRPPITMRFPVENYPYKVVFRTYNIFDRYVRYVRYNCYIRYDCYKT